MAPPLSSLPGIIQSTWNHDLHILHRTLSFPIPVHHIVRSTLIVYLYYITILDTSLSCILRINPQSSYMYPSSPLTLQVKASCPRYVITLRVHSPSAMVGHYKKGIPPCAIAGQSFIMGFHLSQSTLVSEVFHYHRGSVG